MSVASLSATLAKYLTPFLLFRPPHMLLPDSLFDALSLLLFIAAA
jgi:hypothetical protein